MISLPWMAVGAGLIYAAGVASGWAWSSDRAEAKRNKALVAQLQADIKAQQRQAERTHKAQEVTDEELQIARDAADRAARAAVGLRDDARAREARVATAAPECKADAQAAAVYADLFGRADQAAGELAAAADEHRARGIGCERHYEALTDPKP